MRKSVVVQFTVDIDFDTDGDETVVVNDETIKKAASQGILDAIEASYEWADGDGIVDKITDATGWCINAFGISGESSEEKTA
jgi:hypothetical protein